MSSNSPLRILVLCTGNSCRSQMAEGFFRHHGGDGVEVYSAGVKPIGVDLRAIEAMKELGMDISSHTSNQMNEYLDRQFDFVITVCDNAAEQCPVFPGETTRLHWPFEDPYFAEGTPQEQAAHFRRIRDQIGEKVTSWLNSR